MPLPAPLRDPWVWGQFILFILIVAGLPWLAAQVHDQSPAAAWLHAASRWRFIGILPAVLGISLVVAAARTMGSNLTPATTPRPQGDLVQHGLYAHLRHPIYSGVILAMWGIAWCLTTWRTGLVVVAVAWLYFDRKAGVEEGKLLARFPEYATYRARVPKLVPRFRPWARFR